MRAQSAAEDQNANGATSDKQEQDPIERRRLQNRLSQRNHRRKIRDRIAKLQERVIASELRAAASLNGWSYHHPTAPLPVVQAPSFDIDRKSLSPAAEMMPAVNSPCLPYSTGACYSCNIQSPTPIVPSQYSPSFPQIEATAKDVDSSSSSPPPVLINSNVCSPGTSPVNLDMPQNASSNYAALDINGQFPQAEPWNLYAQYSQSNLYYIATEASLPHIMQMLDNGQSRAKAVILLQPNLQVAGVPPPSRSQPQSPREQVAATSAFNMHGLTCQCHTQSLLSESPVDWTHPGASTSISQQPSQ
ncbi:hypothetical protein BDV23DRAFT_195977 [Aspergillus alliaceus]|uniref:BZIP domain-containing protein n=1 Tax=Petromyces alliaceus TaxID=209559 RepID=A0A5N7BZ57_PETAA|nr:hypothetical protein BDV23DRAFT_195977 [Aspergillus alliaceus]